MRFSQNFHSLSGTGLEKSLHGNEQVIRATKKKKKKRWCGDFLVQLSQGDKNPKNALEMPGSLGVNQVCPE